MIYPEKEGLAEPSFHIAFVKKGSIMVKLLYLAGGKNTSSLVVFVKKKEDIQGAQRAMLISVGFNPKNWEDILCKV